MRVPAERRDHRRGRIEHGQHRLTALANPTAPGGRRTSPTAPAERAAAHSAATHAAWPGTTWPPEPPPRRARSSTTSDTRSPTSSDVIEAGLAAQPGRDRQPSPARHRTVSISGGSGRARQRAARARSAAYPSHIQLISRRVGRHRHRRPAERLREQRGDELGVRRPVGRVRRTEPEPGREREIRRAAPTAPGRRPPATS